MGKRKGKSKPPVQPNVPGGNQVISDESPPISTGNNEVAAPPAPVSSPEKDKPTYQVPSVGGNKTTTSPAVGTPVSTAEKTITAALPSDKTPSAYNPPTTSPVAAVPTSTPPTTPQVALPVNTPETTKSNNKTQSANIKPVATSAVGPVGTPEKAPTSAVNASEKTKSSGKDSSTNMKPTTTSVAATGLVSTPEKTTTEAVNTSEKAQVPGQVPSESMKPTTTSPIAAVPISIPQKTTAEAVKTPEKTKASDQGLSANKEVTTATHAVTGPKSIPEKATTPVVPAGTTEKAKPPAQVPSSNTKPTTTPSSAVLPANTPQKSTTADLPLGTPEKAKPSEQVMSANMNSTAAPPAASVPVSTPEKTTATLPVRKSEKAKSSDHIPPESIKPITTSPAPAAPVSTPEKPTTLSQVLATDINLSNNSTSVNADTKKKIETRSSVSSGVEQINSPSPNIPTAENTSNNSAQKATNIVSTPKDSVSKDSTASTQQQSVETNKKPNLPPKPENLKPTPPSNLPKSKEQSQIKSESNNQTTSTEIKAQSPSPSSPSPSKPIPPPKPANIKNASQKSNNTKPKEGVNKNSTSKQDEEKESKMTPDIPATPESKKKDSAPSEKPESNTSNGMKKLTPSSTDNEQKPKPSVPSSPVTTEAILPEKKEGEVKESLPTEPVIKEQTKQPPEKSKTPNKKNQPSQKPSDRQTSHVVAPVNISKEKEITKDSAQSAKTDENLALKQSAKPTESVQDKKEIYLLDPQKQTGIVQSSSVEDKISSKPQPVGKAPSGTKVSEKSNQNVKVADKPEDMHAKKGSQAKAENDNSTPPLLSGNAKIIPLPVAQETKDTPPVKETSKELISQPDECKDTSKELSTDVSVSTQGKPEANQEKPANAQAVQERNKKQSQQKQDQQKAPKATSGKGTGANAEKSKKPAKTRTPSESEGKVSETPKSKEEAPCKIDTTVTSDASPTDAAILKQSPVIISETKDTSLQGKPDVKVAGETQVKEAKVPPSISDVKPSSPATKTEVEEKGSQQDKSKTNEEPSSDKLIKNESKEKTDGEIMNDRQNKAGDGRDKRDNKKENKQTKENAPNKNIEDKLNKDTSKKQKRNENKKGQSISKEESTKIDGDSMTEEKSKKESVDQKSKKEKVEDKGKKGNDEKLVNVCSEAENLEKQSKSDNAKGKAVSDTNVKVKEAEKNNKTNENAKTKKDKKVNEKQEIVSKSKEQPKVEDASKAESVSAPILSGEPDTTKNVPIPEVASDSAKSKKQQSESNKKKRKDQGENITPGEVGEIKTDKGNVPRQNQAKGEKNKPEVPLDDTQKKEVLEKQRKGKGNRETQTSEKPTPKSKEDGKNVNKDKYEDASATRKGKEGKQTLPKNANSKKKSSENEPKPLQQSNKQKQDEKKNKSAEASKKGKPSDLGRKEQATKENKANAKPTNDNRKEQEKKHTKQEKAAGDVKESPDISNTPVAQDVKLEEEEEDEIIQARPVYMANACHVCKAVHEGKTRLKSCGACRMIAYCSQEHQRQHWPQHKSVCKFVRKTVSREKIPGIFANAIGVVDPEEWRQLRMNYVHECEESLGRSLQPYEREMFLYPRVCHTCHQSAPEKLHVCPQCHSVNFCSPDHIKSDHGKWCPELRLLLEINQYQAKYGLVDPPLPDRIFPNYEPLPSTMKEFLLTKALEPSQAMGLSQVFFTGLTDIASYPLTVLYALQAVKDKGVKPPNEYEHLTLHLVGAEIQCEGDAIAKWDVFILHLLPQLKSLRVIFVGPELSSEQIPPGVCSEDFRCAHCSTSSRLFLCDFQPNMCYHDYMKVPTYVKPDAICVFNCGLYRKTGFNGKDTWGESLSSLVQSPEVPVVLTAYTSVEAPKDIERLQEQCSIDVLLPPQKNPYCSMRPQLNLVNDEDCPVIYRNQFVSVVRGKKAQ